MTGQTESEPNGGTGINPPIADHYKALHEECTAILEESLSDPDRSALQGESQQFLGEIEDWISVLDGRPEAVLIGSAAREYQFSLLALAQGHYRHAFKGLRLVLELIVQSVHLSAYTIELHEWLIGRRDTIWAVLVSDDGVLSDRYAAAFFPDLKEHAIHMRSIVKKIYRECSEAVHGNMPNHIPTPLNLEFNDETFKLWHEKAQLVALTVTFVLTMRYLKNIPASDASRLETTLVSRLGHISAIRHYFNAIGGE